MLTKLSFTMVRTKSKLKSESEDEDTRRDDIRAPSRRIQNNHPETQIVSTYCRVFLEYEIHPVDLMRKVI